MRHLFLMVLTLFSLISAQYGQNKVQYNKKDWQYIRSAHFDVYFAEKSRRIAAFAADELEKSLFSISTHIHYNIKKRIPVVIYKSPSDFQQTNVILDDIGEGTGGFTELLKSRVVVPFDGSFKNFRHVLHHELTHAVMFDLIFENVFNAFRYRASFQIPLWVAEGWAEHESAGWNLESDMFLMDAVISGYIAEPRYEFGSMYLAYKAGMAFYNFMSVQYGPECVGLFIKYLSIYKDVDKAFQKATRADLKEAGERFLLDLKKKYWPELGRRETAGEVARRLTLHRPAGYFASMPDFDPLAHMNMQPAVSPDGRFIAYFSDREDFDGIYLMDARTGKILKKIAEAGSSGQFESFHTFNSGIAWSPDSRRILFVSKSGGQDVLRIMDVKKRKVVRTLPFSMDAIESPDWSSTAKEIVFSGMKDAVSDIYLFNMASNSLIKLTSDPNYDTRPRFSPDGRKIVFETEYGERAELGCNNFDLYLMATDGTGLRRITQDPLDDRMACFSGDGRQLYFVSNRSGISNLYCMDLDSLNPRPLTNIFTGCFTPSMPRKGDFIAFSVFENGGWDIYRMENPLSRVKQEPLPQTNYRRSLLDSGFVFWEKYAPLPEPPDTGRADTLKKAAAKPDSLSADTLAADSVTKDTVAADSVVHEEEERRPMTTMGPYGRMDPFGDDDFYRRREERRKPPPVDTSDFIQDSLQYKNPNGSYKEEKYSPRFSFDAVSAMIGAGFSPNQVAMAGTAAFALSDILGNHHIQLMANVYGNSLDNALQGLSGYAAYYYLPYRLDLGASVYRYVNIFGVDADSLDYDIYFDAVHNVSLEAIYPFSRYLRLEGRTGATLITRNIERWQRERDNGQWKSAGTDEAGSLSHYNVDLGTVFDNSLWGMVGPVNGSRMSLNGGVVPPAGTSGYSYGYLSTDLRHYLHFRKKYVLALRLNGGLSASLDGGRNPMRFYLGGMPGNVRYLFMPYVMDNTIESNYYAAVVTPLRGYSLGAANPGGNTRFALANTEFRFPFVNNVSFSFPIPFSIRYLMGALFYDMGAAWDDPASFRATVPDDGTGGFAFHDLKAGLGYGLRLNLFGALVLKWDRAWRLGQDHSREDYVSFGAEF